MKGTANSVLPDLGPWMTFRLFLSFLLLTVSLSACGRRGPLEPPNTAAVPTNQGSQVETGDDDDIKASIPSPAGAAKKKLRAYVIPKDPFILDPLL